MMKLVDHHGGSVQCDPGHGPHALYLRVAEEATRDGSEVECTYALTPADAVALAAVLLAWVDTRKAEGLF
jgi:hypothetical protein